MWKHALHSQEVRIACCQQLVGAVLELHPAAAADVAVNHEAQRKQHMALVRREGLRTLQAVQVEPRLPACLRMKAH